jgi:hypothetical protein
MRFVQLGMKGQDVVPAHVIIVFPDVFVVQNVSIWLGRQTLPSRRVVWFKFCLKFFLDVPIRADNQISSFDIKSAIYSFIH